MSKEVMQQALEALEKQKKFNSQQKQVHISCCLSAIAALREALEKPEQGPVAGTRCKIIESCKSCQHSAGRQSCLLANRSFESLDRSSQIPDWCPLPIYTAPPAKSAKPLTDEQIVDIYFGQTMNGDLTTNSILNFARAIEAAIKEQS